MCVHRRSSSWRTLTVVALSVSLAATAQTLPAQRPDSAAVAVRATTASRRDSLQPPLSPRRAFLYSALIPGYSQSVFGRHRAAALMLAVEAMSIAMITESAADVREARRMSGDTVVVLSYVDANGGSLTTPLTTVRRFDDAFVRTRQSHLEDWIAFLIANHLFSAADAYVAANLWDIPGQLSIRASSRGATVGAMLSW